MQEKFIDAETGWMATRTRICSAPSGAAIIEETVTDPLTGDVFRSSRVASYARPLAAWIDEIREAKQWIAGSDGCRPHA